MCRVSLTSEREREKQKAQNMFIAAVFVWVHRCCSLKYLKKDSDARASCSSVFKTPKNSTNPHITCSWGFLVLRFIVYTGRFLLQGTFYSRKTPMHILLFVSLSLLWFGGDLVDDAHSSICFSLMGDRWVSLSFSVRVCVFCPFVLMKLVHLHSWREKKSKRKMTRHSLPHAHAM